MTRAEQLGAPAVPVWGLPRQLPPPAPLPRRVEVVVIGAGITGVSLLRRLLDADVDAVVVERDCAGSGASGRNAGFLLAGVSDNYAATVRRYGRDIAAAAWRFTSENHALLAAMPETAGCGYTRGGSRTLAVDDAESAELDESATLLAEDGFDAHLTGNPLEPRLHALVNPGDGAVDPLRLVRALAEPVAARIHEGTEVIAVVDGAEGATVHLSDGRSIDAGMAVLATNAWTSTLLASVRIRPIRAQMLAATGQLAGIDCPVYADRGHRYWRRRDDGVVLVGGFRDRALAAEVGFDLTPTEAVQRHLDAQLAELLPRAEVTARWCGTMGFSDDGLPLVGLPVASRHVAVCGGYTGHGMGFAVHSTRLLAAHLTGAATLPSWLDAARDQGGA